MSTSVALDPPPTGMATYGMRHINDADDLPDALKEWGSHTGYHIGYVALHGSPGAVHIVENMLLIAELGDSTAGAHLGDKVVQVGSCAASLATIRTVRLSG